MKVWCILSFLVLVLTNVRAQESGWADSLGYRQQKLTTDPIQQVRFTPSGDSIITVTKNKVWRRYIWDTHTGKLLREQTFSDTNYRKIFSVQTDMDCLTYTVAALWGDGKIHFDVFTNKADSLLCDISVNSANINECHAYYFSVSKILWIVRNSITSDSYARFEHNGIIAQYSLQSNPPKQLYNRGGASFFLSFSDDGNALTWKSLVTSFYTYKSATIVDNVDLYSVIKYNSQLHESKYKQYTKGAGNFYEFLTSYSNINGILSQSGKHYYNLHDDSITHIEVGNYFSEPVQKLGLVPKNLHSTRDDEIMFFSSGTKLFTLHCPTHSVSEMFDSKASVNLFSATNSMEGFALVTNKNQMRLFYHRRNNLNLDKKIHFPKRVNYVDSVFLFHTTTDKGCKNHQWNFGDGVIDSGLYVLHKFSKPGTYTITLRTILDSSSSDTLTLSRTVTVLPKLAARFSASPRFGTSPLTVQFNDESEGNILRWTWDFGDGHKDSVQNPTHTYTKDRYSSVRLTIYDSIESRTIEYRGYINPTDLVLQEVHPIKKFRDKAQDYSLGQYQQWNYYNSFYSGFYKIYKSQLLLYRFECLSQYYSSGGFSNEWHIQSQSVVDSLSKSIIECAPPIGSQPKPKCSYKSGSKIIPFRAKIFITSFEGFKGDEPWYNSKNSGLYFSNNRFFVPDGWSHDFNVACFKNPTDVYLFRYNNKTASLQFFINDTVLTKRINYNCSFIDVFTTQDSNSVCTISSPAFTQSDSTVRLVFDYYSSDGEVLRSFTIPLSQQCSFKYAYALSDNEFLLCGYVPTVIDGKKTSQGYICKVHTNRTIFWDYIIPTWMSFTKIQSHPMGYYAILGRPYSYDRYGFIALRPDGKLLADFRLFDADNNFQVSDLVIGNKNDEIWFIGGENNRATYYQCANPVTPTTDINDNENLATNNEKIIAFPNPAQTSVTIKNYSGDVILLNSIGEVVLESSSNTIDISGLNNGMYYITTLSKPDTSTVLSIIR